MGEEISIGYILAGVWLEELKVFGYLISNI